MSLCQSLDYSLVLVLFSVCFVFWSILSICIIHDPIMAFQIMHIHYCNGVKLKIYLDHKFQWSQESLKCKPVFELNWNCKTELRTLLWSLEFVIQTNLKHNTKHDSILFSLFVFLSTLLWHFRIYICVYVYICVKRGW